MWSWRESGVELSMRGPYGMSEHCTFVFCLCWKVYCLILAASDHLLKSYCEHLCKMYNVHTCHVGVWNTALPPQVWAASSFVLFRRELKTFLFWESFFVVLWTLWNSVLTLHSSIVRLSCSSDAKVPPKSNSFLLLLLLIIIIIIIIIIQ